MENRFPLWFEGENGKFPEKVPFKLGNWTCLAEHCAPLGEETAINGNMPLEFSWSVEVKA